MLGICRSESSSSMTQVVDYCHWSTRPPHRKRRHSTLSWSCDTEGDEGETSDEHTFRRKDQVATLGTKSSIKIDGKEVQVDPQLLFQRLIIVAQTSAELESSFKHELCSYPPAPFDLSLSCSEKHTSQPLLMQFGYLLDLKSKPMSQIKTVDMYWTEEGALIQRIPWSLGYTYICVVNQYTEYVRHRYCDAVLVFDGYDSTNTKDTNHQRRPKGNAGTTVTFTGDTPVSMKKDPFLANQQNKQRFMFMLSEELPKNNCETHHASEDADLLIVQNDVQSATSCNTVLVVDDTDLMVLLCHDARLEWHDLLFCPEPNKIIKQPRIWNIKAVKQQLGPDICQHILELDAVLGCDTTSRLHVIGKGASLKKYQTNNAFHEQAKVLHTHSASTNDVTCAGDIALAIIYNGRSTDTVDSLRHHRFCEKVAPSATQVHPHTLPPKSGAAKYHSMCGYQEYKGSADGLFSRQSGGGSWAMRDL